MRALSCMFTVKERKLISNLAASKTWTIKDRCLAYVSWLTSPFWMRRIGITLDSWLQHDSWTKSAVRICPEEETPPLVRDWSQVPRHSLTAVYMHLSSTLVYNIMSTDARTSGASEGWLGPEPRWLDAYQIFCEPSKHWARLKLGRAAFPMRFQTFPVRPCLMQKQTFLKDLDMVYPNLVTPACEDAFHGLYAIHLHGPFQGLSVLSPCSDEHVDCIMKDRSICLWCGLWMKWCLLSVFGRPRFCSLDLGNKSHECL